MAVCCEASVAFEAEDWLIGVVEARRKVLVPFERGLLQISAPVWTAYHKRRPMGFCKYRGRRIDSYASCSHRWRVGGKRLVRLDTQRKSREGSTIGRENLCGKRIEEAGITAAGCRRANSPFTTSGSAGGIASSTRFGIAVLACGGGGKARC